MNRSFLIVLIPAILVGIAYVSAKRLRRHEAGLPPHFRTSHRIRHRRLLVHRYDARKARAVPQ